jgi:small subunit ribosomal protein S17
MPKRVLTGTVVSDKGDKTIVVRVERRVKHPLYGKIIRLSKKYHAHDEGNAFKLGQQVRIEECKPMSKLKSWTVLDSLGAAPVAVDEIAEVDVSKPVKAAPAPTPSKASKAKANADASETAEA